MDLEAKAAEAAKKALCGRCGGVIMETESAIGTVTGYYRAVAIGTVSPFQLCGECGLKLREFLNPQLVEDAIYRGFKELLRGMWKR